MMAEYADLKVRERMIMGIQLYWSPNLWLI